MNTRFVLLDAAARDSSLLVPCLVFSDGLFNVTEGAIGDGGALFGYVHCVFDDSYFNFLASYQTGLRLSQLPIVHVIPPREYLLSYRRDNGDVECLLHDGA